MNKPLLVVLCSSVLAAHAASQTPTSVYVPSNTPSAGTCNTICFGQRSAIYQCLGTAAQLGSPTVLNICDLAFAPCSNLTITFQSIEITMGQTTATSLSSTFSSNLVTNVKRVFKASNFKWSVTGNQWNRIGLDTPYLYLGNGGSLVIQIVFYGASGGSTFHRDTMPRAYNLNWSGTTPPTTASATPSAAALKWELVVSGSDASTFGTGCPGSNNQTPTLSFTGNAKVGTSFSVNLANALSNAGFFLSLNTTRLEPPLDLSGLGASGCNMYVKNLITLGGTCDSSGGFSLSAKIPTNTQLCQPIYLQFFPFDRQANPLGLTASNYGRALPGN